MRKVRACLDAVAPVLAGIALAAVAAAAPRPGPGPAALTAQAAATRPCTGAVLQVIPASGALADPAGGQGGHLWWTSYPGTRTICIGTIVVWAHFIRRETGILWYKLYAEVPGVSPPVQLIGKQASFVLGPGWCYWSFPVHRLIGSGQSPDVCVAAAFPAGESYRCVTAG